MSISKGTKLYWGTTLVAGVEGFEPGSDPISVTDYAPIEADEIQKSFGLPNPGQSSMTLDYESIPATVLASLLTDKANKTSRRIKLLFKSGRYSEAMGKIIDQGPPTFNDAEGRLQQTITFQRTTVWAFNTGTSVSSSPSASPSASVSASISSSASSS